MPDVSHEGSLSTGDDIVMQWYYALGIIIIVIVSIRVLQVYLRLRKRGPDENRKLQEEAWNKAMSLLMGGNKK
jgi:hypothetical protein